MDLTKREKIGLCTFIIIILVIASSLYFYKNKKETVEVISKNALENYADNNEKNTKDNKKHIEVDINGEIRNPGVYTLEDGDRVKKLVDLAGGFTSKADISSINLAMKLKDEDFISIPEKMQNNSIQRTSGTSAGNASSSGGISALININIATKEQLMELPRIGDAIAQRIIDYRQNSGLFKDIKDITNVSGIGPKMFENIKNKITIH